MFVSPVFFLSLYLLLKCPPWLHVLWPNGVRSGDQRLRGALRTTVAIVHWGEGMLMPAKDHAQLE